MHCTSLRNGFLASAVQRRWLRHSSLAGADAQPPQQNCPHIAKVQSWLDRTVIDLGLCPWAAKALRHERVRYITCEATRPDLVARVVRGEAKKLRRGYAQLWATTLVVCPHAWPDDFAGFDDWISNSSDLNGLDDMVSLVGFHPQFERWHALDPSVAPGSRVVSHFEETDGRRSWRPLPAQVLTTDAQTVGARRISIRFADDGVEQWVPLEWVLRPAITDVPVPDNFMHRSPSPVIHLIQRRDLEDVRNAAGGYDRVAALQIRNHQVMNSLTKEQLHKLYHSDCSAPISDS